MVAIGSGAREMIGEQIRSIGSNLILIIPGATMTSGLRLGSGSVHTLRSTDAEAIARECPAVKLTAPNWGDVTQVVYGNRNWRTRVSGTWETSFQIRDWPIRYGRMFTPEEDKRAAKVAIIGQTVAENLFGDTYPLGKVIRIKSVPFTIIGVLERKGQSPRGDDQDDAVFVPLKTAQYRLFGTPFPDEVQAVIVQAKDIESIPAAERQITELLTRRHKIARGQEKDFTVRNLTEILETAQKSVNIMTTLLGAIAAISLVVGGIGIMNIMLVAVNERIREIGIRKAIGAKSRDILLQFLVESTLISLFGGVAGIVLGISGAFLILWYIKGRFVIALWAVLLATTVSAIVGIFFGVYPAMRAAKLDPVEALRYE
jgi:putative ABC transport system permease protein